MYLEPINWAYEQNKPNQDKLQNAVAGRSFITIKMFALPDIWNLLDSTNIYIPTWHVGLHYRMVMMRNNAILVRV